MTKKNNMFAQAEERRRTELKKTEDAVREEREVRIGTTIMLTARNKTALNQCLDNREVRGISKVITHEKMKIFLFEKIFIY